LANRTHTILIIALLALMSCELCVDKAYGRGFRFIERYRLRPFKEALQLRALMEAARAQRAARVQEEQAARIQESLSKALATEFALDPEIVAARKRPFEKLHFFETPSKEVTSISSTKDLQAQVHAFFSEDPVAFHSLLDELAALRDEEISWEKVRAAFESDASSAIKKDPRFELDVLAGKLKFNDTVERFGVKVKIGEIDLKRIAGVAAAAFLICHDQKKETEKKQRQ
jgi:hypothetical protein